MSSIDFLREGDSVDEMLVVVVDDEVIRLEVDVIVEDEGSFLIETKEVRKVGEEGD